MSDATDQLATATTALASATTAVEAAVTDLNSIAPTTNDNIATSVVSAINTAGLVEVFGAEELVAALVAANYTVTPPAPADAPELPA